MVGADLIFYVFLVFCNYIGLVAFAKIQPFLCGNKLCLSVLNGPNECARVVK